MNDFWTQPTDKDALDLTHAIALQESGNGTGKPNYTAVGDAGTSHGAYQWQPGNFEAAAKEAGLDPKDLSPTNQDKVAYYQVKKYKDSGLDPGQIASKWNSGSPDNWKDHTGTTTINGQAIHYDTPAYVQGVKTHYQQIHQPQQAAGLPQLPGAAVTAPPAEAATGAPDAAPVAPQSIGGKVLDVAKGVGNFLFPVVGDLYHDVKGDSSKTGMQQVGDAALSALPFVPGLGEVGLGAKVGEAAAAGSKLAKGAEAVLGTTARKGAVTGYGAGVAQNLSQGKSLGDSVGLNATNVLSTATGGLAGKYIPKAAELIKSHTTQSGAIQSVEKNLGEELLRTVPGRNLASKLPEGGKPALSVIARTGNLPTVEGNHYGVEEGISNFRGYNGELGQVRAAVLDKIGTRVPIDELKAEALARSTAEQEGASASAKANAARDVFSSKAGKTQEGITAYFDDLKTRLGREDLSPSELESLKEKLAEESGIYKANGDIAERNSAAFIADAARNRIEKLADEADVGGMKEFNQVIKNNYDAISVLQRIGRHVVRGGRLGNMLREHAIGMASGIGGAAMGGGPIGVLGSFMGGELAGKGLSKIMSETSITNPLRDAILEKMAQQEPEVVQRYMDFIGRKAAVMPLKMSSDTARRGVVAPGLIKAGIRGAATTGSLVGQ